MEDMGIKRKEEIMTEKKEKRREGRRDTSKDTTQM